jgi:beta-galactosidase/beta-glucuronidase
VTTPSVWAQSATVHVRSTAINESAAQAALSLQIRILGPNRAAVLKPIVSAAPISLAPGATGDLEAETTLPNPDRWDLNHGTLYKVQATLLRNGEPVDSEIDPFGIREFHFDADQGFFLNGVHHKIFGAAVHTDGGAVGTAVPLGVWERRLRELRKLGVNAIRTAHNPPAPEFLDLADRMGFLVMDEMFDCWTVAKNPYDYHLYFKEWSLRDTADTVMRDRNHPSIILSSAGNEIHDTPKPEIAIPILKSLVDTFHKYDPPRPVTQALFARTSATTTTADSPISSMLSARTIASRKFSPRTRRNPRARSSAPRTHTTVTSGSPCAIIPSTPASSSGPASTTSAKPANGRRSAPGQACCSQTPSRVRAHWSGRAGGRALRWLPSFAG